MDLYDLDELAHWAVWSSTSSARSPGRRIRAGEHESPDKHHFLDISTGWVQGLSTASTRRTISASSRTFVRRAGGPVPRCGDRASRRARCRGRATAKRDLRAGETIDGIGHFMTYGECENHDVARAENLLPMGLAEGRRITRDVRKVRYSPTHSRAPGGGCPTRSGASRRSTSRAAPSLPLSPSPRQETPISGDGSRR